MSLSGQDEYYALRENVGPPWTLMWWPARNDDIHYWSSRVGDWVPVSIRVAQHLSPLDRIDTDKVDAVASDLPQLTRPRLRKWIRFCEQLAEAQQLVMRYPGDRVGWRDRGYWHGYVLWRDQQTGDGDLSEPAYQRHLEAMRDKYLG